MLRRSLTMTLTLTLTLTMALTIATLVPARTQAQAAPPNRVTDWNRSQIELTFIPVAESLYVVGRRSLNQGDYEGAARTLWELFNSYPTAMVAPNALYWHAYALYRTGVDHRSAADLDRARKGLLIHRTVYEQSIIRSDAIMLILRVREARSGIEMPPPPVDGSSDWIPLGCGGPSLGRQQAAIERLPTLTPDSAASLLDEIVLGPGQCLDLRAAWGIYAKLTSRERKEEMIGALGRSIHASAADELLLIVRSERDDALRERAAIWLRARNDPRVEAALRSGR